MANGVTPNGWEGKTFQQLLDEVASAAKQQFGEDFPTTPDSVFGQLSNIFSASTKDLWDLGQAITDSQNRDAAEGVYLDYLAALVGIQRSVASGSTGNLLFSGKSGVTIPSNFPCADGLGRNVLTQSSLTLNRSNCYGSVFKLISVQANTDYSINVEGNVYTYTSGSSPTVDSILDGLVNVLSSGVLFTVQKVEETLLIQYTSYNNLLTTTNSSNIVLDEIQSLIVGEAAEEGDLDFPANSVVTLVGSVVNLNSVTNPEALIKGRFDETDEELRQRIAEREQATGTATKPSIEASISNIEGVTNVLIVENNTLIDDPITGVEAKAYETFVTGGSDAEIAEVIWGTKPATGLTVGDVTVNIIDQNGDTQAVSFSRKTNKYAWMEVTYTINDEEIFPPNGEDQMKNNVVTEGNSMDNGEDYEPTKFYGALYKVQGVYISQIRIALTDNPNDTPTYQTARIPVTDTEQLLFDNSRVVITT
ncbi:protein of unknown function DUF276 [Vibrio phage 1.170.O._10N.261.52.C3]|nr:protein of unknown function DUF276 [Vibrio phage 1.170.O._10N.261.52.C3]